MHALAALCGYSPVITVTGHGPSAVTIPLRVTGNMRSRASEDVENRIPGRASACVSQGALHGALHTAAVASRPPMCAERAFLWLVQFRVPRASGGSSAWDCSVRHTTYGPHAPVRGRRGDSCVEVAAPTSRRKASPAALCLTPCRAHPGGRAVSSGDSLASSSHLALR